MIHRQRDPGDENDWHEKWQVVDNHPFLPPGTTVAINRKRAAELVHPWFEVRFVGQMRDDPLLEYLNERVRFSGRGTAAHQAPLAG